VAARCGFRGQNLKGAKPADLPVEQPMKFDQSENNQTDRCEYFAIGSVPGG
jgi:hypothetical protein